jgi:hypothetical protein
MCSKFRLDTDVLRVPFELFTRVISVISVCEKVERSQISELGYGMKGSVHIAQDLSSGICGTFLNSQDEFY